MRLAPSVALVLGGLGCVPAPTRAGSPAAKPELAAAASTAARTTSPGPRPASSSPARPAAASAPGRFEDLAVEGFLPAVLWVPPSPASSTPLPLLVVAHGAGGAPEPHCELWSRRVGGRGWVLCLRGKGAYPGGGTYYYPDHHWLGREIEAGLSAVAALDGRAIDTSAAVYTGYSQGAVMGALAVMTRGGERFARLLFVEGGQNDWSVSLAQRWYAAGGRRAAFACGLSVCERASAQSDWILRRGGVEVQRRYAPGAGHTYHGAVAAHVDELFEWLVADDPRWAAAGGTP